MPRDLVHTAFDQVQHVQREGAHGAAQFRVVGHHVVGAARVDLGNAEHRGIQRIAVARDDGLQRLRQLHRRHDGVDAQVGHARVGALAFDDDRKFVAGRHDGAGGQAELAGLHAGPVVHAEHGFHRKALEQAVVDHALGAAAAFFSRLEDHIYRARVIAMLGQVLRRGQQHGGVAVVAAGVHLAFVLAGVREAVDLLHGQRVHVGAQAHRAVTGQLAANDADHARATQAAINLDAPFFKLGRHDVGGAEFFEGQFGMRVDVAADLRNILVPGDDRFEQFHGRRGAEKGNATRLSSFKNLFNGDKHHDATVACSLSAGGAGRDLHRGLFLAGRPVGPGLQAVRHPHRLHGDGQRYHLCATGSACARVFRMAAKPGPGEGRPGGVDDAQCAGLSGGHAGYLARRAGRGEREPAVHGRRT
ncbi:hypothetical protein D3C73_805370 [compost metagenome]